MQLTYIIGQVEPADPPVDPGTLSPIGFPISTSSVVLVIMAAGVFMWLAEVGPVAAVKLVLGLQERLSGAVGSSKWITHSDGRITSGAHRRGMALAGIERGRRRGTPMGRTLRGGGFGHNKVRGARRVGRGARRRHR